VREGFRLLKRRSVLPERVARLPVRFPGIATLSLRRRSMLASGRDPPFAGQDWRPALRPLRMKTRRNTSELRHRPGANGAAGLVWNRLWVCRGDGLTAGDTRK